MEVDVVGGKTIQTVRLLGDFPTRVEAERALNDYLQCPYDIKATDIYCSTRNLQLYSTVRNF